MPGIKHRRQPIRFSVRISQIITSDFATNMISANQTSGIWKPGLCLGYFEPPTLPILGGSKLSSLSGRKGEYVRRSCDAFSRRSTLYEKGGFYADFACVFTEFALAKGTVSHDSTTNWHGAAEQPAWGWLRRHRHPPSRKRSSRRNRLAQMAQRGSGGLGMESQAV